jgi:hypothetical protein
MESVIATDNTRCCSINSNISLAIPGSARMSPRSTFQSRNSFTSAFSDGTMPTATICRGSSLAGGHEPKPALALPRFHSITSSARANTFSEI